MRVIDGDTFEAYINGRRSGIGIVGISAPMGNTACGRAATAFFGALVGGGGIRLEEDPDVEPFDRRKRRMYRVVLPDGRSAAIAMAEAGLARPTGRGLERNEIAASASVAASTGARCDE